jgi:hypothetical protein
MGDRVELFGAHAPLDGNCSRHHRDPRTRGKPTMNWKSKLILGILTAMAMFLLTYALPKGGPLHDTQIGAGSRNRWGMGGFCLAVCETELVEGRTGHYAFDGTTTNSAHPSSPTAAPCSSRVIFPAAG